MGPEIAYMIQESLSSIIALILVVFALVLISKGVKVVSQSEVYVVERFGNYTKTLPAGLNLIFLSLDLVAHRFSIL